MLDRPLVQVANQCFWPYKFGSLAPRCPSMTMPAKSCARAHHCSVNIACSLHARRQSQTTAAFPIHGCIFACKRTVLHVDILREAWKVVGTSHSCDWCCTSRKPPVKPWPRECGVHNSKAHATAGRSCNCIVRQADAAPQRKEGCWTAQQGFEGTERPGADRGAEKWSKLGAGARHWAWEPLSETGPAALERAREPGPPIERPM